jgi:hypothetical protein
MVCSAGAILLPQRTVTVRFRLGSHPKCSRHHNCLLDSSDIFWQRLITADHNEFRSGRQQDAFEFAQYFLQYIRHQERRDRSAVDPVLSLEYDLETRLQCQTCQRVAYRCVRMKQLPQVITGRPKECLSISLLNLCFCRNVKTTEMSLGLPDEYIPSKLELADKFSVDNGSSDDSDWPLAPWEQIMVNLAAPTEVHFHCRYCQANSRATLTNS